MRLTAEQESVARQLFRKRAKGKRIKLTCPFCQERSREGDVLCCDRLRETVRYLLDSCPTIPSIN